MIPIISGATPYGKKVQIRLIERGKTRDWLMENIRAKTGMYVDGSNLHKILKGAYRSERIIAAINEILDIEEP